MSATVKWSYLLLLLVDVVAKRGDLIIVVVAFGDVADRHCWASSTTRTRGWTLTSVMMLGRRFYTFVP